jgi:hypothetical protein
MKVIRMKIAPINYAYLENREQQFIQIENLIEAKRKMLLDKHQKINFISKQNQFLNEIKDDYNIYHNYIAQQKKDQIEALNLLNKYINDLTVSGELSKNNIIDAKQEQQKILSELNSIKNSLDNIIKDTNDINTTLKEKNII